MHCGSTLQAITYGVTVEPAPHSGHAPQTNRSSADWLASRRVAQVYWESGEIATAQRPLMHCFGNAFIKL